MSFALMVSLAIVGLALMLIFMYASSVVSKNCFEGDADDRKTALPVPRTSGRAADGPDPRSAPSVSAVPTPQPRDPSLGHDAYSKQARAVVHRWQTDKPVIKKRGA